MMIIGLDTIGDFMVQSKLPTSSTNQIYAVEAKNIIFDEIYIDKNGNITSTDKIDWQIETYLKAKFENDLEAGNIGLGGLTIDGWKIRRRRIDSTRFLDLATVSIGQDGNFYYLDTTPRTDITYEYDVIPMSGNIAGMAHIIQIKVFFDIWWLSDPETGESYPLFVNLELSEINTNIQRHVYEGFDEFPRVVYGKQKYDSGTITIMLLDEFLETNKNYREKFKLFIDNQREKCLRNPHGDVWMIDTFSTRRTIHQNLYRGSEPQDISTFTFDWMEIRKLDEEVI